MILDFIEKYKDQTSERSYHLVKTAVDERLADGVNIFRTLIRCRSVALALAKKQDASKEAQEIFQAVAQFCTLLTGELKKNRGRRVIRTKMLVKTTRDAMSRFKTERK